MGDLIESEVVKVETDKSILEYADELDSAIKYVIAGKIRPSSLPVIAMYKLINFARSKFPDEDEQAYEAWAEVETQPLIGMIEDFIDSEDDGSFQNDPDGVERYMDTFVEELGGTYAEEAFENFTNFKRLLLSQPLKKARTEMYKDMLKMCDIQDDDDRPSQAGFYNRILKKFKLGLGL